MCLLHKGPLLPRVKNYCCTRCLQEERGRHHASHRHMGILSKATLPRPYLSPAHAAAAGRAGCMALPVAAFHSLQLRCSALKHAGCCQACSLCPSRRVNARLCRLHLPLTDQLVSPHNAIAIACAWLAAVSPGSCPSASNLHAPTKYSSWTCSCLTVQAAVRPDPAPDWRGPGPARGPLRQAVPICD